MVEHVVRDDHHPVAIGDADLAGIDADAAHDHRHAGGAGAVAGNRVGGDAHAEGGHADGQDTVDIAHQAIGDEAGDALVAAHGDHNVAGDRGLVEGIGGDEDRIARLGDFQRSEDGEIVAGTGMAGDDGGDDAAVVVVERLDAIVERAAAVHAIDDKAGGGIAQRAQNGVGRPGKVAADGENGRIFDHFILQCTAGGERPSDFLLSKCQRVFYRCGQALSRFLA